MGREIRGGLVSVSEVKEMVLESGTLVSVREIAGLSETSIQSARSMTARWKKSEKIFALKVGRKNYFPLYALDPQSNFKPLPSIHQIIKILSVKMGPWQMAFWFICASRFLQGKTPSMLVSSDPDLVIASAQFEVDGWLHG